MAEVAPGPGPGPGPGPEQELTLSAVCELERGDGNGTPSSCRLHGAALELCSQPDTPLAPVSELYPAVTSSVLLRSI